MPTMEIDLFENKDTRLAFEMQAQRYLAYKALGLEIKSALDIGAAWGHWTIMIGNVFPGIEITQVEPDWRSMGILQQVGQRMGVKKLYVCALGAAAGEAPFYIHPGESLDYVGNGSLRREVTGIFNDRGVAEVKVPVYTMNEVFKDASFDLIKMDTQGSEWEIMDAGEAIIKRAKMLQIELSLVEYNEGEHLFADYIGRLKDWGFRAIDLPQTHYWGYDGRPYVTQLDVLFQNEYHPSFTDYSEIYLQRAR